MKKLSIFIILISFVIVAGCQSNSTTSAQPFATMIKTNSQPVATNTAPAAAVKPKGPTAPPFGTMLEWKSTGSGGKDFTHSYDLTPKLYTTNNGKVQIRYAEISNLGDQVKEAAINELLKKEYYRALNDSIISSINDKYDFYNINYNVTVATDRIISVLIYGSFYNSPAANAPAWSTTINIDLETAKEIDFKSFIDYDGYISLIKAKKYISVGAYDHYSQMYGPTGRFNSITPAGSAKAAEWENGINFYLTYDSIGITLHGSAMSSILDYRIKINDFAAIARKTSTYWKVIDELAATDLNVLLARGFKPDMDQSFWSDSKNFGRVFLMAGIIYYCDASKVEFYLTSKNKILYRLPEFYGNQWDLNYIAAVSFSDVNGDGLEDIIIICNENVDSKSQLIADVYLQKDNDFINKFDLAKQINEAVEEKSISAVLEYLQGLKW